MSKYGFKTKKDADDNFWEFVKEVIIGASIIAFIFLSGLIFISTLSGCTFNFASDMQPAVVIYTDATAGRME